MGAVCYAIYSISTRILARTDSNETTNFYSNLVGAVLVTIAVPFFWTPQSDPIVIVLMCIDGPVQRDRALPADHAAIGLRPRACWRRSSIPRSSG